MKVLTTHCTDVNRVWLSSLRIIHNRRRRITDNRRSRTTGSSTRCSSSSRRCKRREASRTKLNCYTPISLYDSLGVKAKCHPIQVQKLVNSRTDVVESVWCYVLLAASTNRANLAHHSVHALTLAGRAGQPRPTWTCHTEPSEVVVVRVLLDAAAEIINRYHLIVSASLAVSRQS